MPGSRSKVSHPLPPLRLKMGELTSGGPQCTMVERDSTEIMRRYLPGQPRGIVSRTASE